MKNIILIFVTLIAFSCKSQFNNSATTANPSPSVATLDSAYLASKTQYFTIDDYELKGKGKKMIQHFINHSQFVVLGESHGSAKTSELTTTLIPLLSKTGFDDFAVEVGPHSANKLKALSASSENTSQELYDFYSRYNFKEIDDIPIPFFEGIEDAAFLAASSDYKMDLWGLDQEYYSSIIYLTDELLQLAKGKNNFEDIKILKQSADDKIREWMIKKYNADDGVPVFDFILKETAVIQFFDIFNDTDTEARQIIEDIKISWDIYNRYRRGESHNDRVNYIRSNFQKNYDLKSKTKKHPKVLLKCGALHACKVLSGGTYDVGHLTEEIAKKNGTISTNINVWSRYYEIDGMVKDLMEVYPKYMKRNVPFILQGKKNEWAIINLKEIREDLESGKLILPEDDNNWYYENLIHGFDYELIAPVDKDTEANYK